MQFFLRFTFRRIVVLSSSGLKQSKKGCLALKIKALWKSQILFSNL